VDDCRRDHRARGFANIGYHYYITRDGVVHAGRPLYQVGAHATGYNAHSIGICYEGGLDIRGRPFDTRTPEQKETLRKLLERLKEDYPEVRVVGHRDLPGVRKDCPCYEV
jgi:N-acetyl-anhydromuramyl-L-alanine amidase AmpD